MQLEDKLGLGILLFSGSLLAYTGIKVAYHTHKVKIATTNFLDSVTSYFSQRVSKQEDKIRLIELARYRKKCGI